MSKSILVASNSEDVHVPPVAAHLEAQGYDVLCYEADRIVADKISFTMNLDTSDGLYIAYNGQRFVPQDVAAAWNRRPNTFGPLFSTEDRGTRVTLDRERQSAQQAVLDMVPRRSWLNTPSAIAYAGHKITQLAIARELGFEIPPTVVSNQWDAILPSFAGEEIVYKSFHSEIYKEGGVRVVFTTAFEHDGVNPPIDGLPYPGIWQSRQPKLREWRTTIIGDHVFDARVETDELARDDWRRYQLSPHVTFHKGTLPETVQTQCHALLKAYGLRFGTFDFIERPDGQLIFLEMNPNGQYLWLEQQLGLPLSAAVASELGRIAQSA
jgi:hypothetical protein